MPLFKWKDEYSVNVAELDQHHRTLIDILNGIYDNCLRSDATECIMPKISQLLEYAQYHFREEESYMSRIEYFERDEHVEQHAMFIFKIKEMQQAYEGNEHELTKSVLVFLGKWLLHHVLEEDRKYAKHAMKVK